MPIVRSDIRCPFCGERLWLTTYDDEGPTVSCDNCVMDAGHFDSVEQLEETFSRSPDEPMPCPLCGRTPQLFEDDFTEYGQGWKYTIRCADCRMDVGQFDTREEVIRTWNRRASPKS